MSLELFKASLRVVVQRHEILRTSFQEPGGRPVQIVGDLADLPIEAEDLSGLPEQDRENEIQLAVSRQARTLFDFSAPPLFRIKILRLSPQQSVVILAIHHIIADGASIGIFLREIRDASSQILDGHDDRLPELPIQYADYAIWEREFLQQHSFQKTLDYWREKFEGWSGPLELPTDRPPPAEQTFAGAVYRFELPAATSRALKQFGSQERATLYMVLVTVFKILLYKYTHQADITVGTPFDIRNSPEIEPLIGPFINTLVLRTRISDTQSARELLRDVRETVLEAHGHSALPFEKLIGLTRGSHDLSRSPSRAAFFLQNTLLASEYETATAASKFDLSLFMWEQGEELGGAFEYSTDLFDESTIRRMSGHFKELAGAIAENADGRLSELTLLSEGERREVLEGWNGAERDYDRRRTVVGWFEETAARCGERTAVVYGSRRLSYAELSARSNRLARRLRELGVGRDGRDGLVGLCVERSEEMVVAVLGVLKAGGAYVPLDPEYPRERLRFMLEDSGAKVLITEAGLLETVSRARD